MAPKVVRTNSRARVSHGWAAKTISRNKPDFLRLDHRQADFISFREVVPFVKDGVERFGLVSLKALRPANRRQKGERDDCSPDHGCSELRRHRHRGRDIVCPKTKQNLRFATIQRNATNVAVGKRVLRPGVNRETRPRKAGWGR